MTKQSDSMPAGAPNNRSRENASSAKPEVLTVKKQREMRRAQKRAAFKHEQLMAKRRRLAVGIIATTASVAVAALVVVLIVDSGTPKTVPAAIDGVQTFPDIVAGHVPDPVSYPQTAPVGGPHADVWLNCGVYSEPVPNENAVHSLEHGAVWVTYDPSKVSGAELTALRKKIPSTYAILSPASALPSAVVASAWGTQLQTDGVDDSRISEFMSKYRQSGFAPELGAACTGGVDGPGRIS